MQNQSHTDSPNPDRNPRDQIMSNFSFEIMAATSTLDEEGYFQDSSGITYQWKKVTDDPLSQGTTVSLPRDTGIRRMDVPPSTFRPHPDRRQLSTISRHEASPSTPPEDYRHMVSPNFARFSRQAGPGREPTSDMGTVNINSRYHNGSPHENESQRNQSQNLSRMHSSESQRYGQHSRSQQYQPRHSPITPSGPHGWSRSPETIQSDQFQRLPSDILADWERESSCSRSAAPQAALSHAPASYTRSPYQTRRLHVARGFDTVSEGKIPVVNTGGYPPGLPEDSMFPIPVNDGQGSVSSGSSGVREFVAPGEQLIYDSPHRALLLASKPGGDYLEGVLRVFHDEARKQIRLYFNIGTYAESQLVPEKKARIIPYYAYSIPETNVISVYDNHDANREAQAAPQWFIKFHKTEDLLDFQGSLTRENVVLDISLIKSLKINAARNSPREVFSGNLRLQLWCEPRTERRLEGSGGSIISNGTILSGPMRDKTTPNSSKLVIFLARTESFFMSYITDDIEMTHDPDNPCIIKLRARQYDFKHMTRSRSGVMGNIYEPTESPAGFELLGRGINPDEQDEFTSYRSVAIEFENTMNQLNFTEQWNRLLKARRAQREEIDQIQRRMARQGLGARSALKLRM